MKGTFEHIAATTCTTKQEKYYRRKLGKENTKNQDIDSSKDKCATE